MDTKKKKKKKEKTKGTKEMSPSKSLYTRKGETIKQKEDVISLWQGSSLRRQSIEEMMPELIAIK